MAHGDGTIKLISEPGEPERWEVCVSLGLDPDTHKYKRRKRQVEGTYEQAETMRSWLKDPQAEIELPEDSLPTKAKDDSNGNKEIILASANGPVIHTPEVVSLSEAPACGYVPPSRFDAHTPCENITLAELAAIHARKKVAFGKWAKTTEHAYWEKMSSYVLPYLGQVPVQSISTAIVEEYYYHFMEDYRKRTGKSGAGILEEVHRYLRATFTTAVKRRDAPENPCALAERPQYDRPEQGILMPNTMRRLLSLLDEMGEDSFTIAIRISLSAGLRPEEALGCTWKSIDFEAGTMSITWVRTRYEEKRPKSRSGIRKIALDEDTLEHLKAFKEVQHNELRGYGIRQTEETFLVLGRNGKPMGYATLKSKWRRFREKNDIRTTNGSLATQYQLRHTYASLLIANGAPIPAVSRVIGHKDSVITCKVYAHAIPGQEKELASLFGSIAQR